MPMTVPREAAPLTVFIQISLATQLKPNAQPVRMRSVIQAGMEFQYGMATRITTPTAMPLSTERFRPRHPIQ